jgi:clorobiocin biosynthesis protein CloN6
MDRIKADLILLHAPAIYDFRGRDDIALGWYATQESSNVTPIFEMYPLGFLYLKNYLTQAGLKVEIVNVASLMLRHPKLDIEKLLEYLESPIIGIDLHWLPHCHGSIEVAGLIKKVLPETLVLFGGIISTYYSKELMQYPQVDVVVRGYDTLEPVRMLVSALKDGDRDDFSQIPNLIYKNKGIVCDNGFTHTPSTLNDVAIDWSQLFPEKCNLLNMPNLMVLPNTGCDNNCGWCSGAKYSYKRIMNASKKTVFHRKPAQITKEIATFPELEVPLSVYTLQAYSESDTQIVSYLESIGMNGRVKSVSMEQFRLPKPKLMEEMVRVTPNTDILINLSPQTHDSEISRLISGQSTYTMGEMERWLQEAFNIGIKGVYVWYTIGMPKQTYASVMETVEYTARLMEKFPDQQVIPSIFGMIPFLDPGCRFFDEPEQNGYKVFFKDLQSHRDAMVQPLWINSMNYETKWLPRHKFLPCMYEASRKMANYKASFGRMTEKNNKLINLRMDRIQEIMDTIEKVYQKDKKLPQWLREEILAHNEDILSYAADVRLAKKPLTGRWYDDHTVPLNIIDACTPK